MDGRSSDDGVHQQVDPYPSLALSPRQQSLCASVVELHGVADYRLRGEAKALLRPEGSRDSSRSWVARSSPGFVGSSRGCSSQGGPCSSPSLKCPHRGGASVGVRPSWWTARGSGACKSQPLASGLSVKQHREGNMPLMHVVAFDFYSLFLWVF